MTLQRLLALTALLLVSALSWSDSRFYFLAKHGPVGSLTRDGQDQSQVYLRWDLVEGELPDTINSFRLYRNDQPLRDFPAHGVMPASQIDALYQGVGQQRRLLELVSLLQEEAARDDNRPGFAANRFAEQVAERLQNDSYWTALASRNDFNIAMARYRGWKDQPGDGLFRYELRAVDSQGNERRVGFTEVDTSVPQTVMAPERFEQRLMSACDEPDFRDHFTVALGWTTPGGVNVTDQLANQLFISGYELYRGIDNVASSVTEAPERDLAQEAAKLGHNNRGQVRFDDLVKVSDVLIHTQPAALKQDGNTLLALWDDPQWLETRDALAAAGIQPGDRRAYYLVPRDFTGQYGPTLKTLVTIPDLARPPAPWDIRTWLDEDQQRAELSFAPISAAAYQAGFGAGKTICNAASAEQDGVLEYVAEEGNCATDPRQRVAIAIKDYLLYRFDSFDRASAFSDSDGDGFSDASERAAGRQCQAATPFGGARVDARVQAVDIDPNDASVGQRMRVTDVTPANSKGEVYWYRLAAMTHSGRLSLLSEPVRVLFPDRTLPDAPAVSVTMPGDGICGCDVEYQSGGDWSLALDGLTVADTVLSCNGQDFTLSDKELLSGSYCSRLPKDCHTTQSSLTIRHPLAAPLGECTATLPGNVNVCGGGTLTVKSVPCDGLLPAPTGVVIGPLDITVTNPDADTCVSLFQTVSGRSVRVASNCGTEAPELNYEHSFGEFCGYAVAQDRNNNVSSVTPIPCRVVVESGDQQRPVAPALTGLELPTDHQNAAEALVRWTQPPQAQVVVELELTRIAPQGLEPILHSQGGFEAGDASARVLIPAISASTEEWCVRLRSYAPSAALDQGRVSDWSAPLCAMRSDSNSLPQWLAWPQQPTVPKGEPLTVGMNHHWQTLSTSPVANGIHIELTRFLTPVSECSLELNARGLALNVDLPEVETGRYLAEVDCSPETRSSVTAELNQKLPFMVYRQARRPDGQVSRLVQVSPMINSLFWLEFDSGKGKLKYRLYDPYIWPVADNGTGINNLQLVFVDRAGVMENWEYRYQIVWFDDQYAIREWRQSDWLRYAPNADDSNGGGAQ